MSKPVLGGQVNFLRTSKLQLFICPLSNIKFYYISFNLFFHDFVIIILSIFVKMFTISKTTTNVLAFKPFLFLFSTKSFVAMSLIHKFLARIANSEDPDQTATLQFQGSR